ncbi:uncharacterized protein J8A68_000763 [[Candida] subhashii]|uniref:Major facilitator superfamily (MFS) profile domain-containing protein n=1 Tax=[Candida] subhashii TaxID=561895 RepID=A0A8J5QQJ2_9ASCO|nr:uncharacterized protein J8A68_000763 [[Candida] subhashii]KAG7665743.1 hypothetical protein J8A68_000763 [[Candida] subhashii]
MDQKLTQDCSSDSKENEAIQLPVVDPVMEEFHLFNEKPDFSAAAIRSYFGTRFSTLMDLPLHHREEGWFEVVNPFPALREMTASNWNFCLLGFFAWSLDAMDFFCVSVAVPEIAETLGVSVTDISWGVTVVLMLRSVGALIFGLASDYIGRKWSYILIAALFIVAEVGTGLVQTYHQFIGVRALFGILMGSMYPVVTAIEGQPTRARSVISGMFPAGYNLGYNFAIIFYLAFADTYKPGEGWRSLFWFSGGLSIILIVWRFLSPESPEYLKILQKKKEFNAEVQKGHGFLKKVDYSVFVTLKTEWLVFSYLVLLFAGFNFISHGTQDLYSTLLTKQFDVTLNKKTIIIAISNIAAMLGGVTMGSVSELFGRRLTILICMLWCGAFVYPAYFNADKNWWAFVLLMFGTNGSWGGAAIHLLELVNSTHRTLLSGLAYQMGNLISSASMTIEAKLGENFPIERAAEGVYDYAKVMCIFSGAIFAYMVVCIFLGPERFHREIRVVEHDEDQAIEKVAKSQV